jgi:hypothetical protein
VACRFASLLTCQFQGTRADFSRLCHLHNACPLLTDAQTPRLCGWMWSASRPLRSLGFSRGGSTTTAAATSQAPENPTGRDRC